MTEGFKTYLLSVCTAAVLAMLIPVLITQHRIRKTAEFVGGILLLITVLTPIVRIDISEFRQILSSYILDANVSFDDEVVQSNDFVAERISKQCEEYILDKAEGFGMSVDAQVILSGDSTYPLPIGVTVSGKYTPWQKEQLSLMIAQDLGISEDQQEWNSQ